MKIHLLNFGCYEDKTIELKDNFTLLHGKNGTGKSLAFKAICYALYAKHKTVRYGESTSTVTIQTDIYQVKRVSKPMRLTVSYNGKTYEDDKAQGIIEETLIGMGWEQFCLCTWIASTSKSSLATITPMERYNVVRTMVSSEETQEDCEKITNYEKKIKEELIKLKSQQAALESTKEDLNQIEKPDVDIDHNYGANLSLKIQKLEKEVDEHQERLLRIGKRATRAEIKQRIKDIKLRPQLIEKIGEMKNYLVYAKKIEKQTIDIQTFEESKKLYFEQIQNTHDFHTESIKDIDEVSLKKLLQETTKRYIARDEGNPYWDNDPKTIQKLLAQASDANVTSQMKETKQECPYCDKSICIDDDKVVKYYKKFDKIKFSVSPKDIEYLNDLKDLEQSYKNVEKEYDDYTSSKLKIKECERILEKQILSSELVRLNKSIGSDIVKPDGFKQKYSIDYLEKRLEELTQQLGGIEEVDENEEENLQKMLEVEEESEEPQDLQENVRTLQTKLNKLRKIQGAEKAISQYKEIRDKIDTIEEKLKICRSSQSEIEKTIEAIAIIKVKQREAEILSMQNVIESINTIASDYLSMFFDESISVTISMIKKTKANTKMSLEISAQYKGNKYTDMGDFSQGENIRISIAFILALNQLTNSPFLMLDEIMPNIDKAVIEDIYEVLKQVSLEKPIYIIDHNAIHGVFESVLEFSS